MLRTVIVLLFASCLEAVPLRITGPLPSGIDSLALVRAYDSLFSLLKPGQGPDTAPLALIFTIAPLDRAFGLPEWGGGGALGADTIVVSMLMKPFLNLSPGRITLHEMVHIALARTYPDIRLPRWFHEGLAMLLSGEILLDEHVTVSRAIFTHSLLPLSSIDSVNGFSRFRADLAYCQSHLAVGFLVRSYKFSAIAELLSGAEKEKDFETGFYDVFGLTLPEAEKMIREDMIQRYRLVFLFADTYLLWIAVAVLFIVVFTVVKTRNRRKLREMEENESAQAP